MTETKPRYPDHVLEEHRDINVGHNWWANVYECFEDKWKSDFPALERLLDLSNFQFSGFWSQGDGASFLVKGTLTDRPWAGLTFMDILQPFVDAYDSPFTEADKAGIAKLLDAGYIDISIGSYRSGHHYSHSNTVSFNVELEMPKGNLESAAADDAPLPWLAAQALARQFCFPSPPKYDDQTALDRLGLGVRAWARALMNDLYRQLEEEYDHLTSDEAVADAIEANDLYDPADNEDDNDEGDD